MADALLTDDQMIDLTGVNQAAAQRKWLDRNGVFYFERTDGKPRTTWWHVNHPSMNRNAVNDGSEPDFGALQHGT